MALGVFFLKHLLTIIGVFVSLKLIQGYTFMKIISTLVLLLFSLFGFNQTGIVDVAELTLKVGGTKTEELYYGFAEGDQIIFNFEELKGKPLKEIEITELPTNSKFMDFKSVSVVDKKIKVNKKSVYKFSFRNSSLSGRICKIKIQRIPKSTDLTSFNTDWKWKTLYDTSYIPFTEDSIVGYDTTYNLLIKQRLIKDELVLEDILSNHAVKVHSRYYKYDILSDNVGQYNEEIVSIQLPSPVNTKYRKVENLVWYYGVGINQELKREASKTKSDLLNISGDIATYLGRPEMKIAFNLIDKVTTDNSNLAIETGLFGDYNNAVLFLKDNPESKALRWDNIVSSGSIRMDFPLKGNPYLGLENLNGTSMLTGGSSSVTVYVNVSVWVRVREYEDYEFKKEIVTARKIILNKRRMEVKKTKIRVNAG